MKKRAKKMNKIKFIKENKRYMPKEVLESFVRYFFNSKEIDASERIAIIKANEESKFRFTKMKSL